jgi:hypothetical protein
MFIYVPLVMLYGKLKILNNDYLSTTNLFINYKFIYQLFFIYNKIEIIN